MSTSLYTYVFLKQFEHLNGLITKQFGDKNKLVIEQVKIVTFYI